MKTRRHPRTGLRLARTLCNRCGRSFPGRVLLADQAYCPECTGAIGDPDLRTARFAPSRRGPLTPDVPDPEDE